VFPCNPKAAVPGMDQEGSFRLDRLSDGSTQGRNRLQECEAEAEAESALRVHVMTWFCRVVAQIGRSQLNPTLTYVTLVMQVKSAVEPSTRHTRELA
jgi:hypothetical protein